jgi:hypothetical protein
MRVDWRLAAALLGGTRTMRFAGQQYLPKWPNETDTSYATRLSIAVLFPAYKRTVQTLAGKPFSKPITLGEDIPPRLVEWLEDVDLQGRNINAFAAELMETALGYGLAGILVDYPTATGVRTLAQESAAKLRPYWVLIRPEQIIGWRAERFNGSWRLLQLRLAERVEEPDGDFGTKFVEQIRVLTPGAWEIWRETKAGWMLFDKGTTTLPYIPFVPAYGERTGFMTAKPPLIELAHMNITHWQSASDQQTILHVARVPILTVTGVEDDKWTITVGASAAIKLPTGATMAYVEHSGSAIGSGSEELRTLEERMRQAGAELLVVNATGRYAPTATQVATENAVGMCVLQRITQEHEDAIDQALQFTADWVGEVEGGHVTLFNDYATATLQEASAQLLLSANQAGKLSDETLHTEFQRRGILAADQSWDDERARLESQGPALGTLTGTPPAPGTSLVVPPTTPAAPTPPAPPEITPVTPIPNAAPPEPPEPQMDMEGFAGMLAAAIAGITFPAPVVNIQAAAPPVFNMPPITVNVPEGPAPVINVTSPNITVESPTINMPAITLPPPPEIVVNTPPVNVTVQRGGEVSFTEDADGNITGAKLQ